MSGRADRPGLPTIAKCSDLDADIAPGTDPNLWDEITHRRITRRNRTPSWVIFGEAEGLARAECVDGFQASAHSPGSVRQVHSIDVEVVL